MARKILRLVCSLILVGCASSGRLFVNYDKNPMGLAPVAMVSDFGTLDDGIGICKGVMLKVQPNLTFVDITHQLPAFSVRDAARFLSNSTPYFPVGSVFVILVERHTEKTTRPIVAKTKRGQYFVGSDNGSLSLIAERDGIEKVREIKNVDWIESKSLVSTFMGRDVYCPVAAKLARGEDWTSIGPEIDKIVRLDKKILKVSETEVVGEVVALDGPFGNLITDVTASAFLNAKYQLGEKVSVTIGKKSYALPFVKTFDDVPVNENLIYIDSTEHVAVATNQGNFAKRYQVNIPSKFLISIKKE